MPKYIADTVYIYESELKFISRYVLQSPDREIGGDLFGNWTHQACPVVPVAIGPGKNYKADRCRFYQDADYLKEQGAYWSEKHALHHVGQWHSHHKLGLQEPSAHDDATIFNAIQKYGLNEFLLIIATSSKEVYLKAFLYRTNMNRYGLEWNILKSHSPYQQRGGLAEIKLPICIDGSVKRDSVELALGSSDLWLNTEEGRLWLKRVHDNLNEQSNCVRMYKSDNDQIIIACETSKNRFEFVIPKDYPKAPSYWRDLAASKLFTIPQHG